MARSGYLGKISAVVAVNTGGVKPSLNTAKQDIQSWGRSVQSQFNSTTGSAKKAIESIFTPLQRLQAAVNAANRNPLQLNVPNVRSFLDLAKATERIGKPLGDAQKQLSSFSSAVQAELLPAFQSAQKQATQLFDTISSGARIADRDFANTESRINRVIAAVKRANEASQAVRGLADGQELRFQNPEFLRTTSRAAALQQQAAALSPDDIAGRGISGLVAQQRQAAEEAERLRSAIERITITRRGDAQEAQRAYTQQLSLLDRINDALQEQVTLSQQSATARESAAARRSAFDTLELDRRAGVAARRNAASFEDATAGLLTRQPARAELFGRQSPAEAMDRELARTAAMRQQFLELPADVQQSLEQERALLNSIATAARDGAAGAETLAAANDRMAQSIANANSQLEQQAEAARRQAVAAANSRLAVLQDESTPLRDPAEVEAARAAALAIRLPIDTRESDLLSREGESTNLSPRRFSDAIGRDINNLRSQLDNLGGVPLAGTLGPQVDELANRFGVLDRQVNKTREEVQGLVAVSREIDSIQAALRGRTDRSAQFAESFGGSGRAGLDLGIDERALRSYGAQIEYVQGRLAAFSQEARGPAVVALQRYREAVQRAFDSGSLNTEQSRAELAALRQEVVATGAQVTGDSQRRFGQGLDRAGDVARGAFGNAGLAIQQAAFAIDDFFSVTGGLDQRIRAIGNNISQLGFVLGGWQGLVAGVAVSIGSQLVVALVKWYNAGVSSESQTKAINEALSSQKTLVDQLAQSFESLSQSLTQKGFSPAAREASSFADSLREISKQQKELRVTRFTLLDPEAFQQIARANEFARRLESTTDAGQTLAILRQQAIARANARAAAINAEGRAGSFDRAVNAIGAGPANRAEATNQIFGNALDLIGNFFGRQPNLRQVAGTFPIQARERFEAARGNREQEIQVIEQRIAELAELAAQGTGDLGGFLRGESGAAAQASREFARLTTELATLRSQLESDNAIIGFLKTVEDATRPIAVAQERVAEAVKAGVPSALALQGSLDRIDKEIKDAADAIKVAEERLKQQGEAATFAARQEKDRKVAEQTARIQGAQGRREELVRRSEVLNADRIINEPSSLGARTSRAQANLQAAGLGDGQLARDLRVLQARRELAESRLAAAGDNPFARKRAERELQAINKEAAAIESATVALRKFTEYLDRAAQEADGNFQSARQAADQARRAELANPSRRTSAARQRAEDDLRRQEQLRNRVDDEVAKARAEVEENARKGGPLAAEFARIRVIDERLKKGDLTAADQGRFIEERRALQRIIDRAIQDERGVVEARDASTREEERRQSILRGRELTLTPAQRAGLEVNQRLRDIEANRQARADAGVDQAVANSDAEKAKRRELEDAARSTAPAIFALSDSVRNAILQGPSRAALQASDVSTMDGQRELYRLMRGDDPSKNENLIELRKQSEALDKLVQAAERGPDVIDIN